MVAFQRVKILCSKVMNLVKSLLRLELLFAILQRTFRARPPPIVQHLDSAGKTTDRKEQPDASSSRPVQRYKGNEMFVTPNEVSATRRKVIAYSPGHRIKGYSMAAKNCRHFIALPVPSNRRKQPEAGSGDDQPYGDEMLRSPDDEFTMRRKILAYSPSHRLKGYRRIVNCRNYSLSVPPPRRQSRIGSTKQATARKERPDAGSGAEQHYRGNETFVSPNQASTIRGEVLAYSPRPRLMGCSSDSTKQATARKERPDAGSGVELPYKANETFVLPNEAPSIQRKVLAYSPRPRLMGCSSDSTKQATARKERPDAGNGAQRRYKGYEMFVPPNETSTMQRKMLAYSPRHRLKGYSMISKNCRHFIALPVQPTDRKRPEAGSGAELPYEANEMFVLPNEASSIQRKALAYSPRHSLKGYYRNCRNFVAIPARPIGTEEHREARSDAEQLTTSGEQPEAAEEDECFEDALSVCTSLGLSESGTVAPTEIPARLEEQVIPEVVDSDFPTGSSVQYEDTTSVLSDDSPKWEDHSGEDHSTATSSITSAASTGIPQEVPMTVSFQSDQSSTSTGQDRTITEPVGKRLPQPAEKQAKQHRDAASGVQSSVSDSVEDMSSKEEEMKLSIEGGISASQRSEEKTEATKEEILRRKDNCASGIRYEVSVGIIVSGQDEAQISLKQEIPASRISEEEIEQDEHQDKDYDTAESRLGSELDIACCLQQDHALDPHPEYPSSRSSKEDASVDTGSIEGHLPLCIEQQVEEMRAEESSSCSVSDSVVDIVGYKQGEVQISTKQELPAPHGSEEGIEATVEDKLQGEDYGASGTQSKTADIMVSEHIEARVSIKQEILASKRPEENPVGSEEKLRNNDDDASNSMSESDVDGVDSHEESEATGKLQGEYNSASNSISGSKVDYWREEVLVSLEQEIPASFISTEAAEGTLYSKYYVAPSTPALTEQYSMPTPFQKYSSSSSGGENATAFTGPKLQHEDQVWLWGGNRGVFR